jgi:hypothetical protein
MSLIRSTGWYSNNCLHFLKCAVPLCLPLSVILSGYFLKLWLKAAFKKGISKKGNDISDLMISGWNRQTLWAFPNWSCQECSNAFIYNISGYRLFVKVSITWLVSPLLKSCFIPKLWPTSWAAIYIHTYYLIKQAHSCRKLFWLNVTTTLAY